MPRRLRSSRKVQREYREVPEMTAASFAGTDYHAHCPTCGMMANLDRFAEAPHEVQTYFHGYGGQVPQFWEEYPEYREEAMRMMLAHIDNTRAYLMGELGIREEEAEEIEEEEPEIEEEIAESEEEELTEEQAEAMDALADEAIGEYERGETEDIHDIEDEFAEEEEFDTDDEEEEPEIDDTEEEEESDEEDEFPVWPDGQEELELDEEEDDDEGEEDEESGDEA